MTYTPPPPTGYQQPQQWPPPQPPKKKSTVPWYISVLAGIGLIAVVGVTLDEISKSENSGAGSSSTYSAPVTYDAKPADLDVSTYQALTPRDYALITKDPTKHIGERIVVFGEISQFDSATGPNLFMANTAAEQASDYWGLETSAVVTGKPGLFDDVVADDVVKIWATVTGDWTYDTALKVPRTVLSLQANMIEVIPN
ncbi:hypothetical protein GS532_21280 [Rhodococcus hoagii]|nr:hypothetical protein [Prescottella equi]